MSDIAQRIANLSPEKRALLEKRLMNGNSTVAATPAIPRRATAAPCPLSFAQQRLWFFEQLDPGNLLYNLPVAVNLTGPLDVPMLERALNAIVRRHESLRTTFAAVDGSPIQIVAPSLTLPLPVIDLRDLPLDERNAEASRRIAAEVRQPFDLARGPLLRAAVLQRDEEAWTLLLVMHHIISDGWSMGVLFRELGLLYRAFADGDSEERAPVAPLPELPFQYPDFALWQREWLQGERLDKPLSYWKRHLAGAPPVLDLPTDHPRPALQNYRGARETMLLPPSLTAALRELSRQANATLFMTLLAAFAVLLARYSGQDDMVFGAPISGRDRTDTEGLIGLFVNTLALRADLSGDPPFRVLLERVRETALGAYAHADLPFEKLVEELHPERDLSRQPLFQVWFRLQNFPELKLQLSEQAPDPVVGLTELTLDPIDLDRGTAMVDLSLTMIDVEAGLQARLEYDTDLFDAATIVRMLGQYQCLLEGIVTDPEQPLSRLPLLTETEQQRQVEVWSTPRAAYPHGPCLHQLFEAQVEQTPDAIAVACEDRRWTYRELNARANHLAHQLRRRGVGPDVLVGLCMERSLEMVAGLLAILKAGGAYLPLDPDYPKERLAFMLADARAALLLTQPSLLSRLPESAVPVIAIDTDGDAPGPDAAANLPGTGSDTNLAYCIYTSGSTGQPKGVLVNHYQVTRLFQATQPAFQFHADDVWTLFHSVAFDFSVWELWGALLHGGRLVVVPYAVSRSPEAFYRLLVAERVTVLNQTPSAFRALIQAESATNARDALALRLVIFGGEALELPLLQPWFERHGDQSPQLVNMYGITETTVHVTYRPLTAADARQAGRSVIGVPLPDLQVYVLDEHLQPVPAGIPGEIYVGGAGLARGYLNRPELTAARFISDPFSGHAGARLYRTGDLACWRPVANGSPAGAVSAPGRVCQEGELEFLGRCDDQVKLRGFRIETGEIAAALDQHPGVRASAVVRRESRPGDSRLVAYVVPEPEQAPGDGELRRFLREKLPEYMVPAQFVPLAALPLTAHGKVDRRVLPAPAPARGELEVTFVAPHDPLEGQLARIWEAVLGVPAVGVRDNFFDLGGHSLLAVRLQARIERAFSREIPLVRLFQAPTVEQQAALLRDEKAPEAWTSLVPIQPCGSRPPLFCVHGVGGHVRGYRELARHLGPDQPVYGLQAQGMDGKAPIHTRVEEMAAHYIREIRSLRPEGPYLLEGASFGGIVAFEMARQLQAQGQEVALLALMDSYGPGPPRQWRLRALAVRLSAHLEIARHLGPKARLRYAMARMKGIRKRIAWWLWKRRSHSPADHPPSSSSALEELTRIHRRAVEEYRPQSYAGRMILFRARQGSIAASHDPAMGWGQAAAGGVEIHEVPGNHLSMLEPPHLQALAEKLRDCLEKAQEHGAPSTA